MPAPGRSARTLVRVGIVALVLVGATTAVLAAIRRSTFNWVEHTQTVLTIANTVVLEATEVDASVRNHLAAANESARTPTADPATVLARLDTLVDATRDNPAQSRRAIDLRDAARTWLTDIAGPALAMPSDAARLLVASKGGIGVDDAVGPRAGEFLSAERALYAERVAKTESVNNVSLVLMLSELLAAGVVLTTLARRVGTQVDTLLGQQLRLEEQAVELEEQAAELEGTNEELTTALKDYDHVHTILEAALRAAPVAFAFFDTELRFIRVNDSYADFSDKTPEQHVGKTAWDVALPTTKNLDAFEELLTNVMSTRTPVSNVLIPSPHPRFPEEIRQWMLSFYPIIAPDGTLVGAGATIADVTDLHRTTEQLMHAQKMEAVGQLAGGVAHDFNNILAAILAYAELTLSAATDATQRSDLEEIRRATQRGTALTRQLLAFTRKQIVQPRPVNLNTIVLEIQPMLRRLLRADIDINNTLDESLAPVVADPVQIEQIVLNLAVNASDAMAEGGTLTVETANVVLDHDYGRLHADVTPGPYCLLTVTDTGTGMSAATIAKIFEPYFTTKKQGQGTGIGLSTVYAIVRQLSGHVLVYSEPGHGSTFKVYLPRGEGAIASAVASNGNGIELGTERVLLVEDEEQVREATRRVLELGGYEVVEAENGEDALRRLAEEPIEIDVLLTDLMMPGMSGRALADILTERRPELRVVFMSGYTNDSVIRRGLVDSAHAFIQKPVSGATLTATIRAVLDAD